MEILSMIINEAEKIRIFLVRARLFVRSNEPDVLNRSYVNDITSDA